jgi:MFS family permease
MANAPSSMRFTMLSIGLIFAGLGAGSFAAPNNSAIMGAAPKSQQGVASGVLATFRYIGMTAGTTIGGSLFGVFTNRFESQGIDAQTVFLQAFTSVMAVGVVFSILGFSAPIPCQGSQKPECF